MRTAKDLYQYMLDKPDDSKGRKQVSLNKPFGKQVLPELKLLALLDGYKVTACYGYYRMVIFLNPLNKKG